MTNIKWQVSLSNGETLNEDKGNFINDHTSSAWSKLRTYTQENNLEITALSLVTNDGKTFNLPSGGKRPRFSAFYNVENPLGLILDTSWDKIYKILRVLLMIYLFL